MSQKNIIVTRSVNAERVHSKTTRVITDIAYNSPNLFISFKSCPSANNVLDLYNTINNELNVLIDV